MNTDQLKPPTKPAPSPCSAIAGSLGKPTKNRFVVGQRVRYVNHVMGYEIGLLEVRSVDAECVTATGLFDKSKVFKFRHNGIATWSRNLSIEHVYAEARP